MQDLITPMIVASFGGLMVLVVMGFFLVMQRLSAPRFETQDYYQKYRGASDYSRGGNPFRQKSSSISQQRREQRTVALVVVGVAVGAIVLSAVFNIYEALLIIFLLPIILRFIQTRKEANSRRSTHQDENHSPY